MKKIVVVAIILLCGNGYARTLVDLNIGFGFPVRYEPVVYVPAYCPPPPPTVVYYEPRYYRPAPVYVEYRDRWDHGRFHHDDDHHRGDRFDDHR